MQHALKPTGHARARHAVALVLAATLVYAQPRDASREPVWKLDLPALAESCSGGRTYAAPVFSLRFSPSTDALAAIVGTCVGQELKFELLVVPTAASSSPPRPLSLGTTAAPPFPRSMSASTLDWAPEGGWIQAEPGRITDLNSRTSCRTGAWEGIFTGPGKWLGVSGDPAWPPRDTALETFGYDCRRLSSRTVPGNCRPVDSAPARNLVELRCVPVPGTVETVLTEATDGAVLHRWSIRIEPSSTQLSRDVPQGQFANAGQWLCGLAGPSKSERAQCWSIDTGRPVGIPAPAPRAIGMVPARDARRALVLRTKRVISFYSDTLLEDVLSDIVLWDFESGRVIASWPSGLQRYPREGPGDPKSVQEPFAAAISPHGDFIAIGGAGVIIVYPAHAAR